MRVAIVFDPTPEAGHDPMFPDEPRRWGEFIGPEDDVIIIRREYDERFEDGIRTSLLSQGIWENLGVDDMIRMLAAIDDG